MQFSNAESISYGCAKFGYLHEHGKLITLQDEEQKMESQKRAKKP